MVYWRILIHKDSLGVFVIKQAGFNDYNVLLRILTFNIHNGINWKGNFDLGRISDFIKDAKADLAGIQEVSRFWSIRTGFQDMVTLLAEKSGMYPKFSATIRKKGQACFGNLVLSKYPLINTWTSNLPGSLEPRNYLAVQILIGRVRVNFLTTHLGLSREDRLRQVQEIIDFGIKLERPLVISGDFNEEPNGSGVSMLKKNWKKHCNSPVLGTVREKNGLIGPEVDMIFTTSDFTINSYIICKNYLSDHLPVIADYELTKRWPEILGNTIYK